MKENNIIRIVIVDDDIKSIESLTTLISEYCPGFEIVGTANNIEKGAGEIIRTSPDIVFLDVEMPDGNGFDLLRMLQNRDFEVVFITAHNKYAINAIKHSALDFLLKPFELKEFLETIDRIKTTNKNSNLKYDVLLENINGNTPKKLVVASSKGYEYIPVETIVRIESERSYARIFLENGRVIMVSKCLNDYQNMLDPHTFFRIHNSHLVNLNHVIMYVRNDGGYVEMTDKSKIPISRSKKDLFINVMQQFIS
ncbi:MAG: response regulator transcription factor [Bacteroidales bacterium]|nr:response regulator transcription factor [Bacteroidales bacterium]MBN2818591.1 response regulator transcription factor [Bacteroidales bacterium]